MPLEIARSAFAQPEPVATFAGRIGWRLRISQVVFDEPPYLVMQADPVFPGGYPNQDDGEVVWDVLGLAKAAQKPGAYSLITCTCGYASDAGIEQPVLVSHPDPDTIVWEIDIPGLRPALASDFAEIAEGFIRLVFTRAEYEADVRRLLRELQACLREPIAVATLADDVGGVSYLRSDYPALERIAVEVFEPDGSCDVFDQLLAFDTTQAWQREALLPPGTTVTFGFFPRSSRHDLMRIDGAPADFHWPTWLCTRWSVLQAFHRWQSFVGRAHGFARDHHLPNTIDKNECVLRSEADRAACHQAGRKFAALMQASLLEGQTAPGVRVAYCECPLHAAEPRVPDY